MHVPDTIQHPRGANAPDGHRLYASYFRWLPLLWLAGAHVLAMLCLVAVLAWRRWPTSPGINLLVLAWAAVTVTQALAVVVNWADADLGVAALPGVLLSVTVIGWAILAVGLAVGYSWNLAGPKAVRAVMVLALWILLVGGLGQVYALVSGNDRLFIATPLWILAGGGHAADFYTLAMVFKQETGNNRFILFFPWPTALSLAGIAIMLIATCERDSRWRAIGYAGGLFAVVFSFSRAGIVALPIALSIPLVFRMPAAVLAALAAAGFAVLIAMTLNAVGPGDVIALVMERFTEARPGSSQARDLVYAESYRAFLEAPIWGWGWVGPSVLVEEELPIGSHSTFFGTLYTGGLVTFASLALAALSTATSLGVRLLRHPTPERSAATGLVAACALFAYGESFYSLVLPLLFAIMFLGGALRPHPEQSEVE